MSVMDRLVAELGGIESAIVTLQEQVRGVQETSVSNRVTR